MRPVSGPYTEVAMSKFLFTDIVQKNDKAILDAWVVEQLAGRGMRRDLISEAELRDQSKLFLSSLIQTFKGDFTSDLATPQWSESKAIIDSIAKTRARQGFSPSETASFVFSLKNSISNELMNKLPREEFGSELRSASDLLDKLGLYSLEAFQKGREEVIRRQQAEMLELSTPVVELADGIIALPLIGTLDSNRAQMVMEVLLESIVSSHADIAIIDITGVPTVDTLVAQHLMKTVAAARLMGADCIISGIRPQIAQTIVQLGIDLGHVHTKASLADAFRLALRQRGLVIQKSMKAGAN